MSPRSWKQQGFLFAPRGNEIWSVSHAQVPTPLVLADRVRIYYATRDGEGRSRTSFLEVDSRSPRRLTYVHNQPIMDLGTPGAFDEDGVMVSSIIRVEDSIWMYYTGWSRGGGSTPYRVSIGLAVSFDGGETFRRQFLGPIVGRTPSEPYMTMSPFVLRERGRWRMWYGSGTGWVSVGGRREPLYVIKSADSPDGINWIQREEVCVEPLDKLEANTRPCVRRTDDGYAMWFCYRGSQDFRGGPDSYRMGFATSTDGISWKRKELYGLEPGKESFSTGMMAYPAVVELESGRLVMFHNGDGFGKSGFGYSTLDV